MAFDGVTVASIVDELQTKFKDGRLVKIAQPEKDELLLTIKAGGEQYRLLISADASLPLIYLTNINKTAPLTAPNFCMLLRKHLQNAKIISITQPGLERVVIVTLEHLDELGDLCRKKLIVEIMGKHSNIIFATMDDVIIDSIKHISSMVSSVREVLPGKPYFIPETQNKENPLQVNKEQFKKKFGQSDSNVFKAIYMGFTGISPLLAHEICMVAKVSSDMLVEKIQEYEIDRLFESFQTIMEKVRTKEFSPCIIYDKEEPIEYASIALTSYEKEQVSEYESISQVLETYYSKKNALTRIRQRSTDLRRIVQTALERSIRKFELQQHQLEDTEKREQYRVYGELLNTYGYEVQPGSKSMEALNYYTDEMITIPLNTLFSASENAKKYFERYQKLKRTYEALQSLLKETEENIAYLGSIYNALDIALKEPDLVEIREELIESGYIKKRGKGKRIKITSKPMHYISSDGYHIYVGKNNLQNDHITFKVATGNDWWFHAKGIPGSHVLVKSKNEEVPDSTFEEAASLAAHYSKGKAAKSVEVDYVQKKQVKKPSGAKPGFVVYYTNFSMVANTDISGIKECFEDTE